VVLGVRSMTPYCFGCDRVLGVGGTNADATSAAVLRHRLTCRPLIYHHRPGVGGWDVFDAGLTSATS
jgi:hypothetical protein